jgi:hypothetical protein
MFLTSKNGHFGQVVYSIKSIIEFKDKGYTIYEPIYTKYGYLHIPTQSKMMKMYLNGELKPMEFIENQPYVNGKELLDTSFDY